MLSLHQYLKFMVDFDDLRIRWEGHEGNQDDVYKSLDRAEVMAHQELCNRLEQKLGNARCGGCESRAGKEPILSEWHCTGFGQDMNGNLSASFYCKKCNNHMSKTIDKDDRWVDA